ncbi:MAG TPA: phosphoglycerate mutase family protein [Candidatus Saccharimonadaceae bacterium]|jgi:phosphohistidine phosphatase SixA|nr:phosphoglycerate mutase family protein [Candidatus Saccharimonadaceae bacterium]
MTDDRTTRPRGAWPRLRPWLAACATPIAFAGAMAVAHAVHAAPVPRAAPAEVVAAVDTALTTVYVVRHAEKNAVFAGADPPLSEAGARRADALARALADAHVTTILTTHFARTRDTVRPLAAATGDSITVFDQTDAARVAAEVWTRHAGEAVLVVGHSDTVPAIVRALAGRDVPPYREGEFDRLYVVVRRGAERPVLLALRYGEGTAK